MQVSLKDLSLAYDDQLVLNQISCTIPDGQLVALLGPSGSGKTTILNLISGLLNPTEGQIFFGQNNVLDQPLASRNVGMVFQDYALYPHLNVLHNIAFPLKMKHVKKAERLAKAEEFADITHVRDLIHKFPIALSGGQKQRVAIARALIKNPAILLLDEPLSNLDTALRIQLRDEIRYIQQLTKTTTVFVTHDQMDALHIADQIIVIADGKIQQVGTGKELYTTPKNQFVAEFIGTPKLNTLPASEVQNYLNGIDPSILDQAKTFGFRSETILGHQTPDTFGPLPTQLIRHYQLGRDQLTELRFNENLIVATNALDQTDSIYIAKTGSFLFDRTGQCIWNGGVVK